MNDALTLSTVQGQIKIENSISAYQPSNEIIELTKKVKSAYQDGETIQNYPFEEFNGKSLIQRMNEDQRAWLSWSPEPSFGDDDWRWTGVRPITRNKVISTAAHLTSQLIYPNIFAQNEFDEEDRDAAHVMRELVEYHIRRSDYETSFLFGVISGLVNPVTYFKVDYAQGWQEIWDSGSRERVIDEVFSGFQFGLIPPEDVLISNAYQYELQKQDWIIEKSLISMGQAEALYGDHENFTHVKPGKKVILHEDGVFYDVEDMNDSLVEKVCFKSRRTDTELYFLGGIYLGNTNTEYNPFYHRTNKNKPRYNLAKFGAEPIDAKRFWAYKSLVAKMANDQEAIDREWQMFFDAGFLSTFPPLVTMGAGKIDRSVVTPATVTEIGREAKIEPLQVANPLSALQGLREAERSLTESSSDSQLAGNQQGDVQKTARESMILQQNAQTNLGIMGKMIGTMVKDVGELLVDDIIRYQTIGEATEIAGQMAYKTFIVGGKVKNGTTKTSYIRFTDRHAGRAMGEKEKAQREYELMEEAGKDKDIYEVNPALFARMDYLITIDSDQLFQRNDSFEKALKLEVYDRAIANPVISQDQESMQKVTRDFLLEPLLKGEASKYMPQTENVARGLIPKLGEETMKPGSDFTKNVVRSAAMEKLLVK